MREDDGRIPSPFFGGGGGNDGSLSACLLGT